jgi:hypothetical protein
VRGGIWSQLLRGYLLGTTTQCIDARPAGPMVLPVWVCVEPTVTTTTTTLHTERGIWASCPKLETPTGTTIPASGRRPAGAGGGPGATTAAAQAGTASRGIRHRLLGVPSGLFRRPWLGQVEPKLGDGAEGGYRQGQSVAGWVRQSNTCGISIRVVAAVAAMKTGALRMAATLHTCGGGATLHYSLSSGCRSEDR